MNIKEILKNIEAGDVSPVTLSVKIKHVAIGTTKSEKQYYNLELVDNSGTINAKKWDKTDIDEHFFIEGNVLKIKNAEINYFNGVYSLIIKRIGDVEILEEYNPSDFEMTIVPGIKTLKGMLNQYIGAIKSPNIKKMCEHLMSTQKFQDCFFTHPAAEKNHHAEERGLIFHEVRMMEAADKLCDIYGANKDIVMAAILFHDIGKLDELKPTGSGAGEYTKFGLLGHIFLGASMIQDYFYEGVITEEEYIQLAHCVLSHHGQIAWGSPIVPATKEANLVHFVDNLDAKMFCIQNEELTLESGEIAKAANFVLNGARVYKP